MHRECCGRSREGQEELHVLVLARVNHARDDLADVGACADEEEDAEEQLAEVE